MRHAFVIPVIAVAFAVSSYAQETDWSKIVPDPESPQGENMQVPEGWKWRLDKPNPNVHVVAGGMSPHDEITFVNMTPGWHITTGPAAIFYHPALSAEGSYRAEAAFYLFPPGERNEAYGLLLGGSDLADPDQSYLYFLVRRSGEYLIKRRDGDSTSTVQDWTEHPSIVPFTDETAETTMNVLTVEAHPDSLAFLVNGEQVTSIPRVDLPSDGLIGLRVNHALSVHISDLKVETLQ